MPSSKEEPLHLMHPLQHQPLHSASSSLFLVPSPTSRQKDFTALPTAHGEERHLPRLYFLPRCLVQAKSRAPITPRLQVAVMLSRVDMELHQRLKELQVGDCLFAYRLVIVLLLRDLKTPEVRIL